MAEKKLRRKSVTVTFSGDDDVVQHIVDSRNVKQGKSKGSKTRRQSYPQRRSSKVEDIAEDSENEEEVGLPQKSDALVDEENHVFGSDVYQFKTPKKSGQMAQLASESRTPKSQPSSESRTPKSILKTPVQKKDAARRKSVNFTPSKEESTPSTPSNRRVLRQRKPEATTPYRLHKRQAAGDSDSDDSLDSSGSDSDSEDEDKPPPTPTSQKLPPVTTPTSQKVPPATTPTSQMKTRRKTEEVEMPTSMVEEYFDIHSSGAGPTSDTTLSKLDIPRMDQETLNKVLSSLPSSHVSECKQMYEEYREMFSDWMYQMCNGFNILLYGLGSKRNLIEDFRTTMLKGFSHVVVNGYFPSLTVKHILNSVTEELLDHIGSFKNPLDQCDYIKNEIEKLGCDYYIVIHSIDGGMLRNEKTQTVLSQLAQVSGLHVIASIDHINSSLVWDQAKCSRFNWLWFNITTFSSYQEETSYENSLLVQQTGGLALSSLTHVVKSLTPNAKGLFLLLARYQLENKDNSTYLGMSLQDLYQRCRELFLVNSDLTLQAQLTEFRDHKMIRSKKSFEGIEYLMIPIDAGTLTEFIEQHTDS